MEYNNRQNILHIITWFKEHEYPDNFIAGLLGNWQTETANTFDPKQVQLSYLRNESYGIKSNDDYVTRVDNGTWHDPNGRNFSFDRVGFGLMQLTSSGRKDGYLNYCKAKGSSVGDLISQCEWADIEIHSTGYANVRKAIKENWSVEECARIICTEYERPAKKDDADVQQKRINYAVDIYNEFFKESESETTMANKILALSCGHYKYTSGKRCDKSLDPNETREWVLNARVGEMLTAMLNEYEGVTVLRLDDPTGEKAITIQERRVISDKNNADFYLAIHHNALGRVFSGGGIVAYYYPDTKGYDKTVATKFYNTVVGANGLKGNRSQPVKATTDLYEVSAPKAISILLENGFMDSKTDTPIILTEEFARNTARGICDFFVNYWSLKKKSANVVVESPKPAPTPTPTPVQPTTPYIGYSIKKGDTLGAVAQRYGVTLTEIAKANPEIVNLNKIYVGQVIKIPTKNKTTVHTVVSGDTLSKIGKQYNIAWKDIAKANNIGFPYIIHKGQNLIIPAK